MRKEEEIALRRSRASKTRRGGSGRRARLSSVPPWAWAILYYVVLLTAFRFLVHPYIHDTLERQTMGAGNAAGTAAAVMAYLLLCLLPPFAWSRIGLYHPIWRGVESFVCYAGVALVMGSLFSLGSGDGWTPLSGLCAGGPAWARIGSLAALFLAFIAASWWGGKKTAKRHEKRGAAAGRRATSR